MLVVVLKGKGRVGVCYLVLGASYPSLQLLEAARQHREGWMALFRLSGPSGVVRERNAGGVSYSHPGCVIEGKKIQK